MLNLTQKWIYDLRFPSGSLLSFLPPKYCLFFLSPVHLQSLLDSSHTGLIFAWKGCSSRGDTTTSRPSGIRVSSVCQRWALKLLRSLWLSSLGHCSPRVPSSHVFLLSTHVGFLWLLSHDEDSSSESSTQFWTSKRHNQFLWAEIVFFFPFSASGGWLQAFLAVAVLHWFCPGGHGASSAVCLSQTVHCLLSTRTHSIVFQER